MVVQLPAVPGVRDETLLTNVYFPVGSQSAERTQIFSLLTQLADYAVSHNANILAGGEGTRSRPGTAGVAIETRPLGRTVPSLTG